MFRAVILLLVIGIFPSGVLLIENDYDKSVRTYRENKLDSATWHNDLAIQRYLHEGKTDSLVLARVQKALLIWESSGTEAAIRYTDTTLTLSENLPINHIARVAALSRMGRLYVQRHEFSQAQTYFTKAEKEIRTYSPHLHYVLLYNNIATMYIMQERYADARRYVNQAYQMNLELEGKDGITMPILLQTKYLNNQYSENYELAAQDGEEFQRVMSLHYAPDHPNMGIMHNSLALIYERLKRYEDAMYHRQRALNMHFENYTRSKDGFSLAAAYQNMGILYGYIHEPFLAQEYLGKGSLLLEKTFGKEGFGMVKPLVDIAINKYKAGQFDDAEIFFQRALSIQQKHAPEDLLGLAYIEGFMANMYLEQNQYDRAIHLSRTVANRYRKANATHTENALQNLHSLARALSATGQYQEALAIQKSNLHHFRKLYPKGNDAIAFRLYSICQTYLDMDRPDKAFAYSDSVFHELMMDQRLPSDASDWFSQLPHSFHTMIYVLQRADILYRLYALEEKISFLTDLLEMVEAYHKFISENLYNCRSQASIIELADINKDIYSLAIDASWILSQEGKDPHYNMLAFHYSEMSKALMMRLASNSTLTDLQYTGDDPIQKRDQDFRRTINALNLNYLNEGRSDSLLTLLSFWSEQYRLFQDSLKSSVHPLFANRFDLHTTDIDVIRTELLIKGQTLIEYCTTESAIFIFVITEKSIHIHKADRSVISTVLDLQDLATLKAEDFSRRSLRLYEALIKPIEPYFSSEKLLIIPDGELHYLNFEILIKNNAALSYDQMAFLVYDYEISYLLSATSAVQFKKINDQYRQTKKTLIFTPVFTDEMKANYQNSVEHEDLIDRQYLYLFRQPFALELAKKIGKTVKNRDIFVEQSAEEKTFKNIADQYYILHLGTHAEINNQSPLHSRIFFAKPIDADSPATEDGYLHAYELYAMQLRADLAVLSACETGSGTWRKGEGVISLAHGFMHAGCTSVVMALWKIDERSSADIMAGFYARLTSGIEKSTSLRQAKLDFIKENKTLSNPYYWAGVVLVGNAEPIYPNGSTWILSLLVLGGLSLLGFYLFKRWKAKMI